MIAKIEQYFMVHHSSIPIVLCPLAAEAQALAPLARAGLFDVRQIGPGPQRIRLAMAQLDADQACPVLLAGTATGLDHTLQRGTAVWVNTVVNAPHQPTWLAPTGTRSVRCAQTSTLLRNRTQRALFADNTNADIADMESLAFAQCAGPRPGRWGIVRGISDAWCDALPQLDTWVDEDGDPRPWTKARHLATQPWTWASAARTSFAWARAMNHVQRLLGIVAIRQ
jgi:hypothetical protein